jgi:hypothetical protein
VQNFQGSGPTTQARSLAKHCASTGETPVWPKPQENIRDCREIFYYMFLDMPQMSDFWLPNELFTGGLQHGEVMGSGARANRSCRGGEEASFR